MPFRPTPTLAAALAAVLALAAPPAARAQLAGPYLAAQQAGARNDHAAAADYALRALDADRGNPALYETALLALVGSGAVGRAIPVARAMREAGFASQLAALLLLSDRFAQGDFAGALTEIGALGRLLGPVVEGLGRAWAETGSGRMSEGLEAFDRLAAQPGMQAFALFHKALALAAAGDFEGAAEILSGEAAGPLRMTRRGVIAYAEVLSQLEQPGIALELLDRAFDGATDPELEALTAALREGLPLPVTIVRDARDGMAEVLYSLAMALRGEAPDNLTLAYARIAAHLRPDHSDALLLAAQTLAAQGQYGLAAEAFAAVPRDSLAVVAAEIGRAEAIFEQGGQEEAIALLRALAEAHPDRPGVHAALGDLLRRLERYDEASQAYDRAIALIGTPQPRHWALFYTRGITHEREKRWELAEADFLKALELNPDQPQVLNYLGYSWVEMRHNLEEALAMIERAVAARPEDGYIIDSLAWALYRLGRFEEALAPMERAVRLMPSDPILNDHLGDIYWALGRRREAMFQWRRALAFGPEEADRPRILRKLEVGLDRVLEEEGEPPLPARPDGG